MSRFTDLFQSPAPAPEPVAEHKPQPVAAHKPATKNTKKKAE